MVLATEDDLELELSYDLLKILELHYEGKGGNREASVISAYHLITLACITSLASPFSQLPVVVKSNHILSSRWLLLRLKRHHKLQHLEDDLFSN